MNFLTGIIIGFIIGWLFERVRAWLFWQRNDEQAHGKLAEAGAEIEQLRARLAGADIRINQLKTEATEYKLVQEKLAAAEAEIEQLRLQLAEDQQKIEKLAAAEAVIATVFNPTSHKQDHLEMIQGIGPTFARRFREAGIKTFADLSKMPPERIRKIAKTQEWQKIDPESWIAQAKKLAGMTNGNSAKVTDYDSSSHNR